MKHKQTVLGHILALLTVIIWGVTYLASDYLLESYSDLQLLSLRFLLAWMVLWLIRPKRMKIQSLRQELTILALSLSGVLVYYWMEARAIVYGGGTNVSILISTVPMWTLLLLCLTTKQTMKPRHLFGFLIAIAGVVLVVYNGAAITFSLELRSVLFAFGACFSWAIYSRLIESLKKVDTILMTRRMLFYTLIFMIPLTLFTSGVPDLRPLWSLGGGVSIAVLGVLGGGLCYIWWKSAIDRIGVVTATNYIYLSPFITMITAVLLGREDLSLLGIVGTVLILAGILLSNR